MNTGLFGGAFNPIHLGHMELARHYLEELQLNRILFIPTAIPPHKTSEHLAPARDRINMLKLAIDADDRYDYTDIEFRRSTKSYTYDTLTQLKKLYPDDNFFLIIGSDQFFFFRNWYRAQDILSLVTVVTAAREENEYSKLLEFKSRYDDMKHCIVSNFDVLSVSSSQIRLCVKNNEDISAFVPDGVAEYIKDNKLYV